MAPVIVQLAHAAGGGAVTVRLDPAELGQIQVRVGRADDGSATVQVTVERPETLHLLTADQPQLHRALDNAGVPQDGRSLTLSLGTPGDPGRSGGNGSGGGAGGGGWRNERPARPGPSSGQTTAASAWLRAGVDITA